MEISFQKAREKYKPSLIKCLFLAEAPPELDSNRFFYFEKVSTGDTLFITTMKGLFAKEFVGMEQYEVTRLLRANKTTFLKRFQELGFYLEDASSIPMPDRKRSTKRKILLTELEGLLKRMEHYVDMKTPVILISAMVHEVCSEPLKKAGVFILNDNAIPFPIGFQPEYIAGIIRCLKKI